MIDYAYEGHIAELEQWHGEYLDSVDDMENLY